MNSSFQEKLSRKLSIVFILFALLFSPFLFKHYSMGELIQNEGLLLSVFALLLLVFGILLRLNAFNDKLLSIAILLIMILGLELSARWIVHVFNPDAIVFFEKHNYRSYKENESFQGHPFLQYKGKENVNQMDGKILPFNNEGFPGKDLNRAKQEGVKRIACIGGSTTANGYPRFLESALNSVDSDTFEVINAGLPGYTTAHSLMNFSLNLLHFDLDAIVIHHSWNDGTVRGLDSFQTDYGHAYQVYESPFRWDRLLVRYSVIYRYLKYNLLEQHEFSYLSEATLKRQVNHRDWSKTEELIPYKKNLVSICQLASANDIKVYLTTMPFSRSKIEGDNSGIHINQCNQIIRELSQELDYVQLIDVDLSWDDRDDLLRDVAHCTEQGMKLKAEYIASGINNYSLGKESVCD